MDTTLNSNRHNTQRDTFTKQLFTVARHSLRVLEDEMLVQRLLQASVTTETPHASCSTACTAELLVHQRSQDTLQQIGRSANLPGLSHLYPNMLDITARQS